MKLYKSAKDNKLNRILIFVVFTFVFILFVVIYFKKNLFLFQSKTSTSFQSDFLLSQPCPRGSENFNCYRDYYTNIVKKFGISQAFADLKKRYEVDDFVRSECHQLTHVIGHAAASKFENVSQAFYHGDHFCWSGYYHGILESILSRIGRENLTNELNNICKDIPGKDNYSFDYYNCLHGLGHGIMALTHNELFEALSYCDILIGEWEQKSCASGVYMENIMADSRNHVTKYLKPDNPLYPCDISPEKYKDECYKMQTSYMLRLNNYDFKQTFNLCRQAEPEYRELCYQSLGRDASGLTISNLYRTKEICFLGETKEQKLNCIIGAAKDFVSYYHSDQQAIELCNLVEDNDIKTKCLDAVISFFELF